jgi:mono/diheme cytochrome c family protein
MGRCVLPILLVGVLAACHPSTDYPRRKPPQGFLENPGHQKAGRILFEQHCVSCHGTIEEGRSPSADHLKPQPTDFASKSLRSVDPGFLFWRISKGKTVEPYLSKGSAMPAWGHYFSDRQIWELVAYLRERNVSNQ